MDIPLLWSALSQFASKLLSGYVFYFVKTLKQVPTNKKENTNILFFIGRSDWIRTSGLLVPNQALYLAEPHPVACIELYNKLMLVYNMLLHIVII